MKIKLLIATGDGDYADHLSDMLSDHHADTIEVSVSRTRERFCELIASIKYDAALLEPSWIDGAELGMVRLPMLLKTDTNDEVRLPYNYKNINKYQRVSSIVESIFVNFAKITGNGNGNGIGTGNGGFSVSASVTAVWSPAGGVGKTTVALAYAARRAALGAQVLYLDLEGFSSIPVYFTETGNSISLVFEMLENREGNAGTLIRGIRKKDADSGLFYLCKPDNFDDMNILSVENISALLEACSGTVDELVVDLPCLCDERTRGVFDVCEKVFLVIDSTETARVKCLQFIQQNSVFMEIKSKMVLIANRAAKSNGLPVDTTIRLPVIQSADASMVYKALSCYSFGSS